ncbi:hypothetical protein BJV74DRAFT_950824 [Russula compacta]|nr:hypothetical protein BJV74DRAFT_950824 [Russula compacta]
MSHYQSLHQTINFGNGPEEHADTGRHRYPPQSAQTPQGLSHLYDSSGPLFAMYLKIAEEQDQMKARLLKGDTDQILIFCGLFSAAIAALVVVSMGNLQPDAQSISNFFLAELFTPSPSAVWVNSLWLLSLLISLTCALLATSLQQWARRHVKVTASRYSLPEQARMRAFFAAGIETLNFAYFVQALPFLVHLSLLLFFAGFLVFVFGENATIFTISCCWIGLFNAAYLYITFMPVFRPESPFYTPLSDLVARICAGSVHLLKDRRRDWFSCDMMDFAEEKARGLSAKIDGDVLKRTLDALRGDHDLEQFFESIPGFCDSEMVDNPQCSLDILGHKRLAETLEGFWSRTLSSKSVPDAVKGRRIIICMKVIDVACLSQDMGGGVLQPIEIGHSLRKFGVEGLAPLARCMISGIISNVQERDGRWFSLAMDQLGVSEGVLRSYLAYGDSVSLANLIHFTRQFIRFLPQGDLELTRESFRTLRLVSKVDIQHTLPELQRDFCALWNEIVQQAQINKADNDPFMKILVKIRHLYIALHHTDATLVATIPNHNITTSTAAPDAHDDAQDLDPDGALRQPDSYPLCNLDRHSSMTSSSYIHKAVGGPTGGSHPPLPLPAKLAAQRGNSVHFYGATIPNHNITTSTATPVAHIDAQD